MLRHQIDLAVVLPEGYEEYDKGGHGDHEPGGDDELSGDEA